MVATQHVLYLARCPVCGQWELGGKKNVATARVVRHLQTVHDRWGWWDLVEGQVQERAMGRDAEPRPARQLNLFPMRRAV